jgi:hypothetical protein
MNAWALLALGLVMGTSHGEPAVQVVGLEGRAADAPAIHLVGGQAAALALQITSPMPGRMSVRGSLYQLATGVAVPIAKDLSVADEFAFDGSSIRRQRFVVTPPEVRAATLMELRFATKMDAGETWQSAGTARLVVYPADTFTQIKAQLSGAARRASVTIAVLGESPQLKALLREAGLSFEEVDAASDAEAGTLYLSECSADAARALLERLSAATKLLVFTRDLALPPGVYWTERDGGFTAKITLPVLADLDRAPDRQWLLLKLFERAFRLIPNSP